MDTKTPKKEKEGKKIWSNFGTIKIPLFDKPIGKSIYGGGKRLLLDTCPNVVRNLSWVYIRIKEIINEKKNGWSMFYLKSKVISVSRTS